MGQESMNSRMMRMGRNELNYGRVLPIQEIMDKINAVTVNDIASLSERLFANEEFSMATVGPVPGSVTESDEDEEETEE